MSAVIANQIVDPSPKPILTAIPPNFTSANLRVSLDEFAVDPKSQTGNRFFQFSFTVDILKDGAPHHTYSESRVSNGSSIPQIVKAHLAAWNAAYAVDLQAAGDFDLTQPANTANVVDPDVEALQGAMSQYLAQKGLLAIGIITADDAALAASLQAVKDAYAVNTEKLKPLFVSLARF